MCSCFKCFFLYTLVNLVLSKVLETAINGSRKMQEGEINYQRLQSEWMVEIQAWGFVSHPLMHNANLPFCLNLGHAKTHTSGVQLCLFLPF